MVTKRLSGEPPPDRRPGQMIDVSGAWSSVENSIVENMAKLFAELLPYEFTNSRKFWLTDDKREELRLRTLEKWCRNYSSKYHTVEDFLSDTNELRRVKACLRRIFSNLCYDWGRDFWRNLVANSTSVADYGQRDSRLEELPHRDLVQWALERLKNEDHRQAITLHYLMSLSATEISDRIHVNPSTVRSWIKRGIDSLREEFKRELGDRYLED